MLESFLFFPPQAKFQSLTIAETHRSLVTNACLRLPQPEREWRSGEHLDRLK